MKNALIYLIVFAALQILVESVLKLISTQVLAEPLSVVNITIMSMSLSGVLQQISAQRMSFHNLQGHIGASRSEV